MKAVGHARRVTADGGPRDLLGVDQVLHCLAAGQRGDDQVGGLLAVGVTVGHLQVVLDAGVWVGDLALDELAPRGQLADLRYLVGGQHIFQVMKHGGCPVRFVAGLPSVLQALSLLPAPDIGKCKDPRRALTFGP